VEGVDAECTKGMGVLAIVNECVLEGNGGSAAGANEEALHCGGE
jgi:hypothetical protein